MKGWSLFERGVDEGAAFLHVKHIGRFKIQVSV